MHLAGSIPATGGDLELDSVELEAFLAAAPGTAIREGSVEIGSGIVTLDRRDEIAGQLRITAPMKLIVEGRSDTLDVERVDDVDEDLREILLDRVESASMVLRVANGIPIGVSIDVGLDPDSSVSISNPVVTLPAGGPLEVGAPETDAEGLAEGPVVVVSRIEISQDDLDALFGTDRFFASTKVRLQSSEGREIWIRGTDPIEIAAHLEVTATVGTIR